MDQKLKQNLTSSTHWLRFLYMVLFAILFQVAISVMWVLVIIQFFFALITGTDNASIRNVCAPLSIFIFQIITYLTYNSDEKPFPFSDWPKVECECDDCDCESECESECAPGCCVDELTSDESTQESIEEASTQTETKESVETTSESDDLEPKS